MKRRHGKRQSVKLRRRCRKHGKCKRHRVWEAARCQALEENEMNAHPEENGDYIPDDAMDVNDGAASPGKKKKKERVLVERTGDARCKECMSCKATCLVEEVRVKK